MLKNVFVNGSDAVVDESLTQKNGENTDPDVVVAVALFHVHKSSMHSRKNIYSYFSLHIFIHIRLLNHWHSISSYTSTNKSLITVLKLK